MCSGSCNNNDFDDDDGDFDDWNAVVVVVVPSNYRDAAGLVGFLYGHRGPETIRASSYVTGQTCRRHRHIVVGMVHRRRLFLLVGMVQKRISRVYHCEDFGPRKWDCYRRVPFCACGRVSE